MPRFALLEHQKAGQPTHWDLMLESGPTLATWALEAFPNDGETPIPARKLADHRPLYLDYEGPLSENRGTVRQVDAGTYRTLAQSDHTIAIELDGRTLQGPAQLQRHQAEGGDPGSDHGWIFRRLGKTP